MTELSIGTGIAITAVCAIPIAAMFAKRVTGYGLFFALVTTIVGIAMLLGTGK